ncbi:MAG: hypothetical protein N2246_02020, partial [Candidatus Sumerlaeia bacterium]|nr:hypothetical protein [Candidatus Sumerlaeia bacterium]
MMNNGFMTYLPGGLMILVFLIIMVMMYLRRVSALIALPIMALFFSLIGIVRYGELCSTLIKYLSWEGFSKLCWGLCLAFISMGILAGLSRFKVLPLKIAVWGTVFAFILVVLINLRWLNAILTPRAIKELVACLQLKVIVNDVIQNGALLLYKAYSVAIFGGMLAILVRDKGIAETFIKYAAELAGDKPVLIAILMMLVSFMLLTTLG